MRHSIRHAKVEQRTSSSDLSSVTDVVVVIVFGRTGVWWVVVRNKAGGRLKVGNGNFMWMCRSFKNFDTPLSLDSTAVFTTNVSRRRPRWPGRGAQRRIWGAVKSVTHGSDVS